MAPLKSLGETDELFQGTIFNYNDDNEEKENDRSSKENYFLDKDIIQLL